MLTTRKPLKLTTAEYDRMADAGVLDPSRRSTELIGGQLFEMAPIGTPHLIAVTRLSKQLAAIQAEGRLLVQQPIRLPPVHEPQPDLVVLREPLGLRKPEARDCALVIEVADTSLEYDQHVKLPLYLDAGVPEVWIVDLRNRAVITATSTTQAAVRYTSESAPSSMLAVNGIVVDLWALFDGLSEVDS